MELVERFFHLGKRVVGSPNPIAIFLAGCRECLVEWELQAAKRPRGSSAASIRPFAHMGKTRADPMRRSSIFRTRVRVGQASRPPHPGGWATGARPPVSESRGWREIRAQVLARARWVCQACLVRTRLEGPPRYQAHAGRVRTSTSTDSWRSVPRATPKRMRPTCEAGW